MEVPKLDRLYGPFGFAVVVDDLAYNAASMCRGSCFSDLLMCALHELEIDTDVRRVSGRRFAQILQTNPSLDLCKQTLDAPIIDGSADLSDEALFAPMSWFLITTDGGFKWTDGWFPGASLQGWPCVHVLLADSALLFVLTYSFSLSCAGSVAGPPFRLRAAKPLCASTVGAHAVTAPSASPHGGSPPKGELYCVACLYRVLSRCSLGSTFRLVDCIALTCSCRRSGFYCGSQGAGCTRT